MEVYKSITTDSHRTLEVKTHKTDRVMFAVCHGGPTKVIHLSHYSAQQLAKHLLSIPEIANASPELEAIEAIVRLLVPDTDPRSHKKEGSQ